MNIFKKIVLLFVFYLSINSCTEHNSEIKNISELSEIKNPTETPKDIRNLSNDMGFRGLKLNLTLDSIDLTNFSRVNKTPNTKEYSYYSGAPIKIGEKLTKDVVLTFYKDKLSKIEFRINDCGNSLEETYSIKYGATGKKIENYISSDNIYIGKRYKFKGAYVSPLNIILSGDKIGIVNNETFLHEEITNLNWQTEKIKLSLVKSEDFVVTIIPNFEKAVEKDGYEESKWGLVKNPDEARKPTMLITYQLTDNIELIEAEKTKGRLINDSLKQEDEKTNRLKKEKKLANEI